MTYTLIIDTREKNPWNLESRAIQSVIAKKLNSGDYSIEGLENKICIERKQNVAELAGNVTQQRFMDELERMSKIERSYLLLEFSIDDILAYPVGSDIPKSKWKYLRVKGQFIINRLTYLSIKYNIHVIFCGDRDNAENIACGLLRHTYDKYKNN